MRSAAPSTCKSAPGQGTTFTIKIPLTLAIVSALIVECAEQPLRHSAAGRSSSWCALKSNSEHRIEHINRHAGPAPAQQAAAARPSQEAARAGRRHERRGRCRQWLHRRDPGRQPDLRHRRRRRLPYRGDRRQADVARKLRHITMFSGNTILGDGSVIMIIDPNGIVRRSAPAAPPRRTRRPRPRPAAADERQADLDAGLPRRRQRAEGRAALARHAPRGDRGRARSSSRTAGS